MLDMRLIEDTIAELEGDVTSFENCEKLATLYICRMNAQNVSESVLRASDSTLNELSDILPTYYKYVDTKKRYQQYEVVDKMLIYAMQNLCDEIIEFISSLYKNTETSAERTLIIEMINNLRGAI